jgi:hypothetical protein
VQTFQHTFPVIAYITGKTAIGIAELTGILLSMVEFMSANISRLDRVRSDETDDLQSSDGLVTVSSVKDFSKSSDPFAVPGIYNSETASGFNSLVGTDNPITYTNDQFSPIHDPNYRKKH